MIEEENKTKSPTILNQRDRKLLFLKFRKLSTLQQLTIHHSLLP